MSDRNIREPNLALAQRLSRLEKQVRAMALRTWSGAIRTAEEDRIEPEDSSLSVLLSVTATAGRWVAIGTGQFVCLAVASRAAFRLQLAAVDPTSGDELSGDDFHFPFQRFYLSTATSLYVPLTTVGHFVVNEVVTVTLSAANDAGSQDAYYVDNPQLILIPV